MLIGTTSGIGPKHGIHLSIPESKVNHHWFDPSKQQGAQKRMVWCRLWKTHVLGSFFFEENVTGNTFLNMLN